MSDTPRTDSDVANGYRFTTNEGIFEYVTADFARQLERELAAVTLERDRGQDILTKATRQGLPNLTFHDLNRFLLEMDAENTALHEDKADLDWLQHDPQARFVRAIETWMKPGVITIRDAIRTVRKETL